MKRREFIRNTIIASTAIHFPYIWVKKSFAHSDQFKLTILQTNDTHSRIDPFPMDGEKTQGLGGIARRATLVKHYRKINPNTLLLDAGDVLQGTPYFNFYQGKIEYQTMRKCGYDASTLGNHEFDKGVDSLAVALGYANFDIVNCNYLYENTVVQPYLKRYIIRDVGPIKIGITGVGIDFTDLVLPDNHKGLKYFEPYNPLQETVNLLRDKLSCNLVIVLSHLGYQYEDNNIPSDINLAKKVHGIDWIVGGHTHTFMERPDEIYSTNGYKTRILQVGFGGILLGKTDMIFEEEKLVAVNTDMIQIDSTVSKFFG